MRHIVPILMVAMLGGCLVPASSSVITPDAKPQVEALSTASLHTNDAPAPQKTEGTTRVDAPSTGAPSPSAVATSAPAPTTTSPQPVAAHTRTYFQNSTGGPEVTLPDGAAAGFGGADARFHVEEGAPVRALLFVTWDDAVPLPLDVTFFDQSHQSVAKASGDSPLLLRLPVDAFDHAGRYTVSASPEGPGLMVNATVTYELALDYD